MSSVVLNPTSEEPGVAGFIYTLDMAFINIHMQKTFSNFLPADLCNQVADQVRRTKIPAKHRGQILANNKKVQYSGQITTIGSSFAQSQLDAMALDPNFSAADYRRISRENNLQMAPQLLAEFGELYQAFIPAVERATGLVCEYVPEFGLPGFHIVYPDTVGTAPRLWHYDDVNQTQHDWSTYFADFTTIDDYFDNHYAFTVLIQNPGYASYDYFPASQSVYSDRADGMINVCQDHMEVKGDTCGRGNACVLNHTPPVHVPYQQGDLNLVQGRYLHRLGRTQFDADHSARITFQCFGSEHNGVVYLHW
jgi:hypothetical protein